MRGKMSKYYSPITTILAALVMSPFMSPSANALSRMFGARGPVVSISKISSVLRTNTSSRIQIQMPSTTSRLLSSGGFEPLAFRNVNKKKMKEILVDVEKQSRKESGYVVIDVRGEDEIADTGKISSVAETLPLPYIQNRALSMSDDEFLENFGFEKPQYDETIVFTCKAGIRSRAACQMAAMEGYTDVINYTGGSNEWFS